MSNTTYDKLGQFSPDELPEAPTYAVVSGVQNTQFTLTWTNNSSGFTGATNVVQTFDGVYWNTVETVDIDVDTVIVDG